MPIDKYDRACRDCGSRRARRDGAKLGEPWSFPSKSGLCLFCGGLGVDYHRRPFAQLEAGLSQLGPQGDAPAICPSWGYLNPAPGAEHRAGWGCIDRRPAGAVLVLCEASGRVRDTLTTRYRIPAVSADVLPSVRRGPHILVGQRRAVGAGSVLDELLQLLPEEADILPQLDATQLEALHLLWVGTGYPIHHLNRWEREWGGLLSDSLQWGGVVAFPPCQYLSSAVPSWAPAGSDRDRAQRRAIHFVRLILRWGEVTGRPVALENPRGCLRTRGGLPSAQEVCPSWFGARFRKRTGLWLRNLPKLVRTHETGGAVSWVRNVPDSKGRRSARSLTSWALADAMGAQWGARFEFSLNVLEAKKSC